MSNGGTLTLLSSAFGEFDQIFFGGLETVSFGATENQAAMASGGVLDVFGVTSNGNQHGSVIIESGGRAVNVGAAQDGSQFVLSGGTTTGTAVDGGSQIVSSGGVTSNTSVFSSSIEIVSGGGTASNTSVFSGGTLELTGNGASAPGLTVSAGGTVIVESGAVLSGFTVNSLSLIHICEPTRP